MRSSRRLASSRWAGRDLLADLIVFRVLAMRAFTPSSYIWGGTSLALACRQRPVSGAGYSLERSRDDVGVHADAPENTAIAGLGFDIANGLGILARAGGMLVVVAHLDTHAAILGECLDIARDRTVAVAADRARLALDRDLGVNQAQLGMAGLGQGGVPDESDRRGLLEVFLAEGIPDQLGQDLLAGVVSDLLDHLGELDLKKTRQVDAVVHLQDVGDAAFARLAIDSDDRFVGASEIGGIDRQVGHFPDLAIGRLEGLEALVDGILVRARKRGED